MIFTKDYYDSVWGTVHRHDYCPYWADMLKQYSRVLDIGTGCGYLVKLLREHGVDAWGVDTSEYAIANTCAPGYVLNVSVTDLPFADECFDLVFSNGLWEYLTLDEIEKGAKEIWRVTGYNKESQIHNIDHDKCDFREDFVTWKPLEWWDEQLAAPKVLVSCPTHESKEYAHQAWIDMARALDYPNYEIFVVDNSPTPDCYNRWKDKIPMAWLGDYDASVITERLDGDAVAERIAASMEIARQKFLREDFRWWFNVEIDVIPASAMLKTLLNVSNDVDWIAHCYPARGQVELCSSGMGCSLWSRKLIESFSFEGSGSHLHQGVDAYFWNWVRPQSHKFPTIEFWGRQPIKHLEKPE